MPDDFEKTFIPRKRVDPSQAGLRVQTTVDTFTAASLLLFSFVFFVGLSLFGARAYVATTLDRLDADVVSKANLFSNADEIQELVTLDTKISHVSQIIRNHSSLTKVFTFLETSTLASVNISNMNLVRSESGGVILSLEGEAQSYNSLAFQSKVYKESQKDSVANVVFSSIEPNTEGRINFHADLTMKSGVFQFPQ